jgi:hypothetical protein
MSLKRKGFADRNAVPWGSRRWFWRA